MDFCCLTIHSLGLEAGFVLFLVVRPNAPMIVAGVFFEHFCAGYGVRQVCDGESVEGKCLAKEELWR